RRRQSARRARRPSGSPRPRHRPAALHAQRPARPGGATRPRGRAVAVPDLGCRPRPAHDPPRPQRRLCPRTRGPGAGLRARPRPPGRRCLRRMNHVPPSPSPSPSHAKLRVALVTGLSGGGKASILRAMEDLGYEAVDNPPLTMLEEMVARGERNVAIGVDARTRGFDAGLVLAALARLRTN